MGGMGSCVVRILIHCYISGRVFVSCMEQVERRQLNLNCNKVGEMRNVCAFKIATLFSNFYMQVMPNLELVFSICISYFLVACNVS
jgi:hypothetical protein